MRINNNNFIIFFTWKFIILLYLRNIIDKLLLIILVLGFILFYLIETSRMSQESLAQKIWLIFFIVIIIQAILIYVLWLLNVAESTINDFTVLNFTLFNEYLLISHLRLNIMVSWWVFLFGNILDISLFGLLRN